MRQKKRCHIDCAIHKAAVASPRGNKGNVPPPKHGKLAKDGEQLTPQQAMRIDSSRKFKFSLNFLNIY